MKAVLRLYDMVMVNFAFLTCDLLFIMRKQSTVAQKVSFSSTCRRASFKFSDEAVLDSWVAAWVAYENFADCYRKYQKRKKNYS